MRAEREHLAVETRSKAPEGRARADLQRDLDGLYEILDVPLVGQDIVVQDGMVLPQGEMSLKGRYLEIFFGKIAVEPSKSNLNFFAGTILFYVPLI